MLMRTFVPLALLTPLVLGTLFEEPTDAVLTKRYDYIVVGGTLPSLFSTWRDVLIPGRRQLVRAEP